MLNKFLISFEILILNEQLKFIIMKCALQKLDANTNSAMLIPYDQ